MSMVGLFKWKMVTGCAQILGFGLILNFLDTCFVTKYDRGQVLRWTCSSDIAPPRSESDGVMQSPVSPSKISPDSQVSLETIHPKIVDSHIIDQLDF